MRRGIATVALVAAGLGFGGCGCGGTPGLSEIETVSVSAPGTPGLDLSLIGPAQEASEASATEETAVILAFAHTGRLTRVDLLLEAGATAGTVVLELRPVLGDVPDAGTLWASTVVDVSALPPAPGLVSVDLAPLDLRVQAGQRCALVLRAGTATATWWGTRNDWAPVAHAAHRSRPAPGAPWTPWQSSPTDVCFQTWLSD